MEKRQVKTFTMISGKEDEWGWRINARIDGKGKFRDLNEINLRNYAEKNTKRQCKEYKEKHKEEIKKQNEKYRQSKKGKESKRKDDSRRRFLGFNPLNTPLEGIENDAHHINQNDVVYIPHVIHNSIHHSLKNGEKMDLINSIAECFYL